MTSKRAGSEQSYMNVLVLSLWCFSIAAVSEYQLLQDALQYMQPTAAMSQDLTQLASTENSALVKTMPSDADVPLFRAYPALKKNISYCKLGDLPTPVVQCQNFEKKFNVHRWYVKCDNLTGKVKEGKRLFGGNKVRKLEFLLADALAHQARSVMTFGCAGSNHALATAVYAHEMGLECHAFLKPQYNSRIVQRNLQLHHTVGTKLHMVPTSPLRTLDALHTLFMHKEEHHAFPYFIPTGGSCPIGILGYVNAAFELKEQIDAGLMPQPDTIYVPCGSAGTTAGIMLGCKAAQIGSKIIPVAVEPAEFPGQIEESVKNLFEKTNDLLCAADASYKKYEITKEEIQIIHDAAGTHYSLFTQEGVDAAAVALQEGLVLDGVYTAKAFAGALQDLQKRDASKETILFWNTFCSDEFKEIESVDYKKLPQGCHCYFEQPVQPLDCAQT